MGLPLVSVILPSFNSEKFISEAIESVLDQSYSNWELIIIDDGSNDGTCDLISNHYSNKSRIYILTHPNKENRGVSASRRLGINYSKGDYIAFLDSDDTFSLDKLEKQVTILNKNNNIVLVHNKVNLIHNKSVLNYEYEFTSYNSDMQYQLDFKKSIIENKINNSSVMVRAEVLKSVSLPESQLYQFEDWYLWLMLSNYGNFFYINEPLTNYRYHENSFTFNNLQSASKSLFAKLELLFWLYTSVSDGKKRNIIFDEFHNVLSLLSKHYSNKRLSKEFYFSGMKYYLKKSFS